MIKALLFALACALCTVHPALARQQAAPAESPLRMWASPGVSITLHGPDSTLAGVVSGVADLALLARKMPIIAPFAAGELKKLD